MNFVSSGRMVCLRKKLSWPSLSESNRVARNGTQCRIYRTTAASVEAATIISPMSLERADALDKAVIEPGAVLVP